MKSRDILRQLGDSALELDHRSQQLFEPLAKGPPAKALHRISKLGDQPALRAISALLVGAGIAMRDHRLTRAGCRMIIAHEAATFAKDMIKTEIDRTRPRSADRAREKKPKKGKHTAKEMTSFPSGHSAGAIAAARAFAREYPEHGAAAMSAATFVALLQIVRCAHYPTDVAAGLALGLASESASNALWDLTVPAEA